MKILYGYIFSVIRMAVVVCVTLSFIVIAALQVINIIICKKLHDEVVRAYILYTIQRTNIHFNAQILGVRLVEKNPSSRVHISVMYLARTYGMHMHIYATRTICMGTHTYTHTHTNIL